MNYLAIDTSSKYLTVIACREGTESVVFASDCALQHSVRLMDAIENAMAQANLGVSDCDFFCAVTGPGSFTGIRRQGVLFGDKRSRHGGNLFRGAGI